LKGNNIATEYSKRSSDTFVLLRQFTSIVFFPVELKIWWICFLLRTYGKTSAHF